MEAIKFGLVIISPSNKIRKLIDVLVFDFQFFKIKAIEIQLKINPT